MDSKDYLNKIRMPELCNIAKSLNIQYIKKYKKEDLIQEIIKVYTLNKKYKDNENIVKIFPFDDEIFTTQKKRKIRQLKCEICEQYIAENKLTLHKARHNPEPDFILIEVAYKGRILTYQHNNKERKLDIEGYMTNIKDKAINVIKHALKLHKNIKLNLEMECEFKKDIDKYMTHKFQLSNVILSLSDNLEDFWDNQTDLFITRCDELETKESGWTLKRIDCLRININKYTLLRGSSYINLPQWIKNKKACINIKNSDNKCFKYSVLCALKTPETHVDRVSNYMDYDDLLNFKGIEFPVKIQDIPKFEIQNKINITVFCHEGVYFYPLYHNKNQEYETNIDLLYFGNKNTSHYCWIKSLSRLLNEQLEIDGHKKYFCRRCLNYSGRTIESLKRHQNLCFNNESCYPIMPKVIKLADGTEIKPTISFKNIQNMLRHPYVIFLNDIVGLISVPSSNFIILGIIG